MIPTIRPLDATSDRDAVADLVARAADYVALETGLPPDAGFVDDIFHESPPGIGADGLLTLGLFRQDRLDGVASLAFGWPEPADAYLGLMLLDPKARGQGLGLHLLAATKDRARARNARRMLLAVLDENPRARAFWERMGFAHVLTAPPARIGAKTHIRHRMSLAL